MVYRGQIGVEIRGDGDPHANWGEFGVNIWGTYNRGDYFGVNDPDLGTLPSFWRAHRPNKIGLGSQILTKICRILPWMRNSDPPLKSHPRGTVAVTRKNSWWYSVPPPPPDPAPPPTSFPHPKRDPEMGYNIWGNKIGVSRPQIIWGNLPHFGVKLPCRKFPFFGVLLGFLIWGQHTPY